MSEQWRSYQERGSGFWIRSVFWFGVRLGRPVTRCVLWPIVAYFLLTGRAARRASRDFLRVALRRPVRWGDQWRHFFYFAATILDRLGEPIEDSNLLLWAQIAAEVEIASGDPEQALKNLERAPPTSDTEAAINLQPIRSNSPVSYPHLTLPTIHPVSHLFVARS